MSLLFNMLPRLVITFLPRSKHLLICLNISFLGEGNGNPLQYSCRENPRVGGAWWAAVYGIAQSRTWLKRLSSISFLDVSVSIFIPTPISIPIIEHRYICITGFFLTFYWDLMKLLIKLPGQNTPLLVIPMYQLNMNWNEEGIFRGSKT